MLDQTFPTARQLAQMRAVTRPLGLPDDQAEALASVPGMTTKRAEPIAQGLKTIAEEAGRENSPYPREVINTANHGYLSMVASMTELSSENARRQALVALQNAWADYDATHSPGSLPSMQAMGYGDFGVGHSWDHGNGLAARMVEGLAARISPAVKPEKGREFANMSIPQMAVQFAASQGRRFSSEREALSWTFSATAAHSSSDFLSTVVGASVELALSRGYEQHQPEIAKASRQIERDNYREWQTVRTGATSELAVVQEDGEFQNTTFKDEGEKGPRPDIMGRIFQLAEQALANDRIDALQGIDAGMVKGSIETVRSGVCSVLTSGGNGVTMRDNKALFHADHGNLVAGSALTLDNLAAMVTKMRRQKGVGGEALNIAPRFLIVPPELEMQARQIVANIDATTIAAVNPFAGVLEPIVEPGLASATEWYLSADPALADGLAHAYVGEPGPRVETKLGWERPTVEFRVRLDIGFGALDWRALAKNPGPAEE